MSSAVEGIAGASWCNPLHPHHSPILEEQRRHSELDQPRLPSQEWSSGRVVPFQTLSSAPLLCPLSRGLEEAPAVSLPEEVGLSLALAEDGGYRAGIGRGLSCWF